MDYRVALLAGDSELQNSWIWVFNRQGFGGTLPARAPEFQDFWIPELSLDLTLRSYGFQGLGISGSQGSNPSQSQKK